MVLNLMEIFEKQKYIFGILLATAILSSHLQLPNLSDFDKESATKFLM